MPVGNPITDISSAGNFVPITRTLTINGVAFDLSANRSWTVGTGSVTSVGLIMPTGFAVSSSPITSAGDLTVAFASGYSLPTTASQTNWDTAYSNRITSLTTTGNSGVSTLISNTLNVPEYTLAGLGGMANVFTTLGDLVYSNAAGAPVRRSPNITTTKMYLSQTGDGTTSAAPQWTAITAVDVSAVPTSRTLTINGTAFDLTADRTWSVGTVTSVALTMPAAFSVSAPITTSGTLAVAALGTSTQYIRGDGQLAAFPSTASGGSSVNYYLNGSVSSGVVGYQQMDNLAVIGGGTDFTLTGNGLIAQFLTDAGNPNRIEIPGGAWNFEMYFQVSSVGGNQKFYVELLKYDGTTFTSIATSSLTPEEITGGTSTDLYLTSLAVPTTSLLVTDRLAVRVYIVDNAIGRTVTLHTENATLCEIITTFAGGISSLNGLTENTQYFATGTGGSDFNISSVIDTHTFNLPSASATNRGALISADWINFNAKLNNPFLALGDLVYSNAGGIGVRRSGNITTTKMFLSQTGDGTNSAAPQWSTVTSADTGSVPTSRTLTINDVVFDLTANREYSVGDFGTW